MTDAYTDIERGPAEGPAEGQVENGDKGQVDVAPPRQTRINRIKWKMIEWIGLTGRDKTDVMFIFTYLLLTLGLIGLGVWLIIENPNIPLFILGIGLVFLSWLLAKYVNKILFVASFFCCACCNSCGICGCITERLYAGP